MNTSVNCFAMAAMMAFATPCLSQGYGYDPYGQGYQQPYDQGYNRGYQQNYGYSRGDVEQAELEARYWGYKQDAHIYRENIPRYSEHLRYKTESEILKLNRARINNAKAAQRYRHDGIEFWFDRAYDIKKLRKNW